VQTIPGRGPQATQRGHKIVAAFGGGDPTAAAAATLASNAAGEHCQAVRKKHGLWRLISEAVNVIHFAWLNSHFAFFFTFLITCQVEYGGAREDILGNKCPIQKYQKYTACHADQPVFIIALDPSLTPLPAFCSLAWWHLLPRFGADTGVPDSLFQLTHSLLCSCRCWYCFGEKAGRVSAKAGSSCPSPASRLQRTSS